MGLAQPLVPEAAHPGIDLSFGFVLGDAVAFLNAPEQLVLLAADHGHVVVDELALLLLDLARDLLPVAFDPVPVHGAFLSNRGVFASSGIT